MYRSTRTRKLILLLEVALTCPSRQTHTMMPVWHAMPCATLAYPAMLCLDMPCYALPWLALLCSALTCPAMPYLGLLCYALPWHALPYYTCSCIYKCANTVLVLAVLPFPQLRKQYY